MPTRTASATWTGGLKGGKGTYQGESGMEGAYSFGSRFDKSGGSNPEELLAAADAACFSMALGAALERAGTPSESIQTTAHCTMEKQGEGFAITTMRLEVVGTVPGVDEATFQRMAKDTSTGCIISRALNGSVRIEVEARLA